MRNLLSNRLLWIVLSILISIGVLIWVLGTVPLDQVGQALASIHWGWVLVSFMMIVLGLVTRAIRWRMLLDDRLTFRQSFALTGITFMLNQLPLRAGEIARSVLVTRQNVPFVTAATSVVVERLIDTVIIVLMVAWSVARLPQASEQVARGAELFAIFALIGSIGLIILANRPQIPHQIAVRLGNLPIISRLPLTQWVDHGLDGLRPLTHLGLFVRVVLWSIISWGVSLLGMGVLAVGLGVSDTLILLTVLAMGLSTLSIAVPVSVSGLGLLEGAIILSATLVGSSEVTGIALGLAYHGITVSAYLVCGLWGMSALEIGWRDLARQTEITT